MSGIDKWFKDMTAWEDSFYCHCGDNEFESFTYERTVANGEVWVCKSCGAECLVDEQPNQDDY